MDDFILRLWKLLWDVFTFWSFLYKDTYVLPCPERFVQGFFFGGDDMNDDDYMRLALQLAERAADGRL